MPRPYSLTVHSNESLTPHMRRVVLTGDELADFPEDQESGYVKLLLGGDPEKPLRRTYTIRRFDPSLRHLTLDFVDHGDGGPASAWVRRAQPGDDITIAGPGAKKLVDNTADWFLIAGDMSALPAISVNLAQLPDKARGYALIEIVGEEDRIDIKVPAGIDLQWIVNPRSDEPNVPLIERLRSVEWLAGQPYVWFAGEFSAMRQVRRYIRDERGVPRKSMYLSCYWKLGDTDEGMKIAKREDALEDEAATAAV
ncbi:MAG: siderophore-interacting protein [Pseudomonadota bacterium]